MTTSTPREILARSGLLLLVACLGLTGMAANAEAATKFDVPQPCGSQERFEAAIRARVGDDAPSLTQNLSLLIVSTGEGFHLTLRLGANERQLEDKNCTDLFRAAVVMAVALWEAPRVDTSEPAVAPPSLTSTAPDQPVGPVAPPIVAATAPIRTTATVFTGWSISGEVGGMLGIVPQLGPLFGLRTAHDWSDWGLALRLRARPSSTKQDRDGHGVAVVGFGSDASVFLKPTEAMTLELGVSWFALQGTGVGSRSNMTSTRFSVAPRLAAGVIPWSLGSFFVMVGVEGQLLLLRPRFEILGYGEVFQVSRLAGAANLGAGFRFR